MTSDELLNEALAADAKAERCAATAQRLELAIEPLDTALDSVDEVHGASTWEGYAAERSRERLANHHRVIAAVSQDVDAIVTQLHQRAFDLRWRAGQLRIVAGLEDE